MQEVKDVQLKEHDQPVETILLRGREAAELCSVSERTWRDWDLMGYSPRPVEMGRSKYWVRDELIAWARAKCPPRKIWKYRPKK